MIDPVVLIEWLGPFLPLGLFLIIFFECVVLGVILPGDPLLFMVGLFAATGRIPWVRDNVNTILYLMLGVVVIISIVPIITGIHEKRRERKNAEAATDNQSDAVGT